MSIQILFSKAVLFIAFALCLQSCEKPKTGYVDIFRLVNEFELQKEYTEQVKRDVEREKSIIDSVVYTQRLRDSSGYERIKNELYTTLYQKTEQRNKEIEAMLWKRLNPYLVDFGKENGYQYIYGANGTGNVLYADKNEDITDEVVRYVNERYHGK